MSAKTATKNMFDILATEEDTTMQVTQDATVQDATAQDATAQDATTVVDDVDFPVLEHREPVSKKDARKAGKPQKFQKFHVATSYQDHQQHQLEELHQRYQREFLAERPYVIRSNPLKNKEEIAANLTCTKPCHYVLKNAAEGKKDFGVCFREHCTFAHSLEELKLPPCAFGAKCYRRHGTKYRGSSKVDTTNKCGFCHPGESADQYYSRTGKDKPDLPPTSALSRQPKPKKPRAPREPEVASQVDTAQAETTPAIPKLRRADAMGPGTWANKIAPAAPTAVKIRVSKASAADTISALMASAPQGNFEFEIVDE